MGPKPMDVAVFWDLASCPASGGKSLETSGFETVDRIRTLASQFGVIKAFKGYMAVANTDTTLYSSPWQPLKLRSQLQSSGVSLTDVPGEKDVAEKMAIVDMLAYAFDRSPDDTILVLITAEPSFSYTLSFLRLRKYRVVLIAPENEGTLTLLSQASLSFNWTQERTGGSGVSSDAQPKAPEAAGNARSRNSRRSSSVSFRRPASSASDGTGFAEKASVADKTPDVNLDDYLPQRGKSEPSNEAVPSHHPSPQPSYEDLFHRNPQEFLPESLPPHDSTMRSRQSPTPASAQQPSFFPRATQAPELTEASLEPTPSHSADSVQNANHPFNSQELPSSPYPMSPASQTGSVNRNIHVQQPDIHGWYGSQPSSSVAAGSEDHIDRLFGNSGTAAAEETTPHPDERANEAGFSVLVEVLRRLKTNGQVRPLRTQVAVQIIQQDKNAYKKAGTTTFAQYTAKAETLGLVTMGGWLGSTWIALNELYT